MPFFKYQALDPSGKRTEGSLQLATEEAAIRALAGAGYTNVRIVGGAADPPRGPRAGVGPGLGLVAAAAGAHSPVASAPAVPVMGSPKSGAPLVADEPVAWRPTPRATFFLWEQLARFFVSGVGVATSLDTLANRPPIPKYGPPLADIRDRVAQGSSLADAMAKNPGFFSPDEVGAIRSGERGGFLPEAMMACAAVSDHARKMRGRMFYPVMLIVLFLTALPFLNALMLASPDAIRILDKDPLLDPREVLKMTFRQRLPAALAKDVAAVWLPAVLATLAWLGPWFRVLRHRLSLYVPVVGARSQAESLERFGFLCSRLAASGIPAREAFALAAEGVPNLWIRRGLMRAAADVRESEPFSQALARGVGLSPMDLATIANGEVAGDVPGALLSIASAQRDDFDSRDAAAKFAVYFIGLIAAAILVTYMAISLYSTLIPGIINAVLEGT